jgi:hypothetical protein
MKFGDFAIAYDRDNPSHLLCVGQKSAVNLHSAETTKLGCAVVQTTKLGCKSRRSAFGLVDRGATKR